MNLSDNKITGYIQMPFHGENGKSAYEIACDYGYIGTEEEWVDSLGFIPDGTIGKEKFDTEVSRMLDVNKKIQSTYITEDNMISPSISITAENVQNGEHILVRADGTFFQATFGNSYVYSTTGYDAVNVRMFTNAKYPVVFFDEEDSFISAYTEGISQTSSWNTLENIPIPQNASRMYVSITSNVPTVTLIKNAVYEEKIAMPEENLSAELKAKISTFADREYVNKKSLRLPQFMAWKYPGSVGFAGSFVVDGRYVYLCRQKYIYKIDVGCETAPEVVMSAAYAEGINPTLATGLVINGDYIYIGTRRSTAAYPTEEDEGALFVLNKADLSTVSYTIFDKKVSRLILHNNILVANMQMRGWRIYDVTQPDAPVMIYDEDFPENSNNINEAQGGEVFEHDGKTYYAIAGFGACGIFLYDITDPHNPVRLWQFKFSDFTELKNKMHTYSLTVNYPYVYCTMGNEVAYDNDENRLQGVLTLDLTDHLDTVPTEYKLSLIANDDKNTSVTESDTEPSVIKRIGTTIVVNNDARGIAVFDTSEHPEQPVYEGIYTPYDGCCIYKVEATEDGRLFLCDGSKGAGRLYLVRGLGGNGK